MERKPLARVQSRDVRVTFRLSAEEAEALRVEAQARDIEVYSLIRRWLLIGQRMDAVVLHEKTALA
jgi:predicted DNA binding CopG/RHH family protein